MAKSKNTLTHFDEHGNAVMVDVSAKKETIRSATAAGFVTMNKEAYEKVRSGSVKKGDVIGVARVAGIMAAKKVDSLIPMTHPLMITQSNVDFVFHDEECVIEILSTVGITGKTGVEMEALTAVSVAALTIYDMCKAIDKSMVIGDIKLLRKSGGKSGDYIRETTD